MIEVRDRRANAILLAIALCTPGPLSSQRQAAADIRVELAKFRDIEHRLTEAFVNGAQATFAGQSCPSIAFHSGGIISGCAGVNEYFARIKIAPDGSFRLESPGFAITKITGDAERMRSEARFLNALQSTRFVRIESNGITIETEDQATRLRFTRPAATQGISELVEAELLLVRLVSNGKEIPLPPNVNVTLTFQAPGRISGRSAVNSYAGVFTTMPNGKVTIQPLAATQMAGPPEMMALDAAYFQALSSVRQVSIKPDRVVLEGESSLLEFAVNPPAR